MALEYQTHTLEQLAELNTETRRAKVKVTGTPMWVEFARQSALILEDGGRTLLCRFPEFETHHSERSPGPAMRAILHTAVRQNTLGQTNPVTVYGEYYVVKQNSIDGTEMSGALLDVDGLHTKEYAFGLRSISYTHRDELMKMMRASMVEQRGGERA